MNLWYPRLLFLLLVLLSVLLWGLGQWYSAISLISTTPATDQNSAESVLNAEDPAKSTQNKFYLEAINAPVIGIMRTITAYTLSPQENDDTPTIGAWNDNLAELQKQGVQVCASRLYPRGTKLKVGNIQCEVYDKISEKYKERIDVLVDNSQTAREFGKQRLFVQKIN